jgi:hypothetical protein
MTLKHLGLFISPLLLSAPLAYADSMPTTEQFVSLNSWYCEKSVNSADELASKLAQDKRLQYDQNDNLYALKNSHNAIGIIPHTQGCTTFTLLDDNKKMELGQLVEALQQQGYEKISQDISTRSGAMVSQTQFNKDGNTAVLMFPLDKKAKQQASLTTANYMTSGLIKTAQMPSDNDAVEMHRQNAGEAREDGWYPATSTKGDYSVLVPIKFSDLTVKAEGEEDVKSVEMIVARSSEGIKFLSSRTFYTKPAKATELFQNFVSGKAIPNAPRRSLKFKGYDAVLIENSNQQLATSQLVLKVNNTLMVMAVEWPIVHTKAAKQLGDVFFNSLNIK